MSSYLSFYLVPKKSKTIFPEGEETKVELNQTPLSILTYCRSSDVYRRYYDTLGPAYCGNKDAYTELTYEDTQKVIREFKQEDLQPAEERLKVLYKILKEGGYNSDIIDDITSAETELSDLKNSLEELNSISSLIYEIYSYSDFEKVLINID